MKHTGGAHGGCPVQYGVEQSDEERILDQHQAIDRFLAGVERRALRMAELATGSRDEALDLVQDAMFGLVRKYGDRGEADWGPLFHRILQSRIRDWYRRNRVRSRIFGWLRPTGGPAETDGQADPVQQAPDPAAPEPPRQVGNQDAMEQLEQALQSLPMRQQQAFLLRVWEGMDVAETAFAMGCSQGSVKTHYSRAVHRLRELLKDHWS